MTAGGWDALAAEIAALVPGLADGDTLNLIVEPYAVSMQQQPSYLSVETADGDDHLPVDRRLTGADRRHLQELGWRPPPNPDIVNHWERHFPWPLSSADAAAVAELVVRTLREVHGATGPGDVAREQFNALPGR
ncbi:TY-Chap domain-containing protein [Actinoplanes sp. HUAS TT8]|uniref:TY-Chap domain-containing protein n=1 Tax=Actinoplanes sp. HUAS TT8 TaxID=3447453 RepID=UPI003F521CA4